MLARSRAQLARALFAAAEPAYRAHTLRARVIDASVARRHLRDRQRNGTGNQSLQRRLPFSTPPPPPPASSSSSSSSTILAGRLSNSLASSSSSDFSLPRRFRLASPELGLQPMAAGCVPLTRRNS